VPVTPTYPGVYIEELPSGVRTIVGVATSITAFVGYTKRGPADKPVTVFNFGDFEREFGGLDGDSPLSYAVQQFFLNGGGQAIIVRAAKDTAAASVELSNDASGGGVIVLKLTARSAGEWGNNLRVSVGASTVDPANRFNVRVTEMVPSGGAFVPGRVENFPGLTMNSADPQYAVNILSATSMLLTADRGSGLPAVMAPGTSVTGTLTPTALAPLDLPAATSDLQMTVDGGAPVIVKLTTPASYDKLVDLATDLNAVASLEGVGVTVVGSTLVFTSLDDSERSSVRIDPTGALAILIKAGSVNGGTEVDAISAFHPVATGTTAEGAIPDDAALAALTPVAPGTANVLLQVAIPAFTTPVVVPLITDTETITGPADLVGKLQTAIQLASAGNAAVADELGGAIVTLVGGKLVVTLGGRADASVLVENAGADTTAQTLGFTAGQVVNVSAYSPLSASPIFAQETAALGADGSAPGAGEIIGGFDAKTGMYALRDVDLFNLLVLPDAPGASNPVLAAAMTFCEAERAFLIVDLPEDVTALTAAQDWINAPATPKSANAAAYFPRPLIPDPLEGYLPRKMPGAGAIAGLFARTDASRGIWKAPAGTDATLRGPTSLEVPLTDMENGTINPLGLNALRALPVYGHVVWGARTLFGSDPLASQWKYIPVRRVALYIEESLYRGTQWVVFEPNDEPLWAQIRLNIGSFMHDMFRQGAFQGASPRQAYLVKCDSETTTQADIDQGIVNIIVGFAPLKPAEFVVIKITQLAGQLEA
jgi:phage tail sheath protein FI